MKWDGFIQGLTVLLCFRAGSRPNQPTNEQPKNRKKKGKIGRVKKKKREETEKGEKKNAGNQLPNWYKATVQLDSNAKRESKLTLSFDLK